MSEQTAPEHTVSDTNGDRTDISIQEYFTIMRKQDIKELRKIIKRDDSAVIDWVYSLYVSPENEMRYEALERLGNMEDSERFRHVKIINNVLSTALGKRTFSVPLKFQQEELLHLRKNVSDKAGFEKLRDMLLEKYVHTDPYYAIVVHMVYDVPKKLSDGSRVDDGSDVYDSLLFAVCPAKLTKPALGFENERVSELKPRWVIGNPGFGFLYPSFSDRSEDRNEAAFYSAAPDEEAFLNDLFEVAVPPISEKAQKERFTQLIGDLHLNVEDAAGIAADLIEKAEENDSTALGKVDLWRLVSESGVSDEEFEEAYREAGNQPIPIAAIASSKTVIRTDSGVVTVKSALAPLIETREIDGTTYIMIPADGAVTVNGMPVAALRKHGQENERGTEA
jgi:hypothetical protein